MPPCWVRWLGDICTTELHNVPLEIGRFCRVPWKIWWGGAGYTEKALRTRMRDMEQAGFIEAVSGKDDARSKYLMPTERFYESIYSHAEQVKKIFDRKFLLIEK